MPERLAVCFRGYICRGSPAAVKPESSSSTCLQVRESCGFNRGRFQCCFKNLLAEIAEVKPKVVALLGEKVCSAVEKKLNIKLKRWCGFEYFATEHNGIWYLPVQHPSYIYVYKRKEVETKLSRILFSRYREYEKCINGLELILKEKRGGLTPTCVT